MAAEEIEYKGHMIKIDIDEEPGNPREWDNLGIMICFHRRYDLGDEHELDTDDFNDWNTMRDHIVKELDAAIVLPLYLLDHSGLSMSTIPFSCPWDSSQIGWTYITKTKAREDYEWTRISRKRIQLLKEFLVNEINTYDQYLRGEVYCYTITNKKNDDMDACCGFYGLQYAIGQAKEQVDALVSQQEGTTRK
jgi:hypothetical protein